MQIDNISQTAEKIKYSVQEKYIHIFEEINHSNAALEKKLIDWSRNARGILTQDNPFIKYKENLENWENMFSKKNINDTESLLENFQSFSRFIGKPFDKEFWNKELNTQYYKATEPHSNIQIAQQLLLEEWRKSLSQEEVAWQTKVITQLRQDFLTEADNWLSSLSALQECLQSLGLEPGLWVDLSQGNLTPQNIEEFKRWATYLKEDKGVQEICNLLGKLQQIETSEKIKKVESSINIKTPSIDINSKEEITGLRLGKDIDNALPSELALLSNPDTAILFDLKLLESRLLCFEMQGTLMIDKDHSIEIEKPDKEQGPIILCVDTSGSMYGSPEYIAKAVALFLASQAKKQNRACYMINFSTNIDVFELTGKEGISRLIEFLSHSFHGGTDISPALTHAVSILQKEAYKKADTLVISDFVMNDLPNTTVNAIQQQQNQGNKFYSLIIGDLFMGKGIRSHFNQEWVYNPQSSKIQEIVRFSNHLTELKQCT